MDVIEVLKVGGLILGSSVLSTIMTLLFTSKLRKAQRQKLETEVTETTSKIYSTLVKDLNDQLQAYKDKYSELIIEFDTEKERLKRQIKELKKINAELRKELRYIKETYHKEER